MALDPISAALDIGGKLIDRLWPDPASKAQAQLELVKLQQTGELAQLAADTELMKGQLAINVEEAKSPSKFVSGARPFFMWVCAAAFGYKYLVQPFLIFLLVASGSAFDYHMLPELNWSDMMAVALPLLGIGGYRTFEKVKRVTR